MNCERNRIDRKKKRFRELTFSRREKKLIASSSIVRLFARWLVSLVFFREWWGLSSRDNEQISDVLDRVCVSILFHRLLWWDTTQNSEPISKRKYAPLLSFRVDNLGWAPPPQISSQHPFQNVKQVALAQRKKKQKNKKKKSSLVSCT